MNRLAFGLALTVAALCAGCPAKDDGAPPAAPFNIPLGNPFNPPPAKETKPSAVFVPVQPVKTVASAPTAALQIRRSRFFSYALPQGWRIGEDGQFALTLVSPGNRAMTVMVGNAGVPVNTAPAGFVHQKLAALRPQGLRVGQPRAAKPVTGFSRAYAFDVAYTARGVPFRGVAKCNVQRGYDSSVMAMTAAMSEASQWNGYATWLPLVADQVAATNGAAFGVRGVMAQNLKNSMAYADAARNYREWSAKNWQQVTDDRNASTDRRNTAVRELLGGAKTYSHPFGETRTVELPLTYKHYWMDRQGAIVGTDDPSANPNQGSTREWRQIERKK